MKLQLLVVPYDSGHRDARMGAGPERLVRSGLAAYLASRGHDVAVDWIEADPAHFPAEIRSAFELNRRLSEQVQSAVQTGRLPVVLTGNCISSVGVVAGLGTRDPGVLWLDAHADFHTPDSTTSGFLDGMALAVVTGRCWRELAASVQGFRPVPERNVLLVGSRDIDPAERDELERSGITVFVPGSTSRDLELALSRLATGARDLYLHLDLDALDPVHGRANALASPGGLSPEESRALLVRCAETFAVRALTVSAYDPSCDPDGKVCDVAFSLVGHLLDGVAASHGV